MNKELAKQYQPILRALSIASHRAYKRGIQTGSGGNCSMRIPGEEKMIVSLSGYSFIDCQEDGTGWTIADFSGNGLCGGKPSKESALHGYLYSCFPEIGSIVHCHAPWSIAWADGHDFLPCYTWQSTVKLKEPLLVLDQSAPAVPQCEFESIAQKISNGNLCNSFLLRKHGQIAVGKDAIEAEHLAEFIEECAQIECLREVVLNSQ